MGWAWKINTFQVELGEKQNQSPQDGKQLNENSTESKTDK